MYSTKEERAKRESEPAAGGSRAAAQREASSSGAAATLVDASPRMSAQRAAIEELGTSRVARPVVQRELDIEDFEEACGNANEHWDSVIPIRSREDTEAIRAEARRLDKATKFKSASALTAKLRDWINGKVTERKLQGRVVVEEEDKTPRYVPLPTPVADKKPTPEEKKAKREKQKQKKAEKDEKAASKVIPLGDPATRNDWDLGNNATVMTPVESAPLLPSALLPDYSKIDRTADVKSRLDNFMPSDGKQGGMSGTHLKLKEVEDIVSYARQLAKFPFVLKGEGSGDYKVRLQVKFITHQKSSNSNITFHLSVTQKVFDALTGVKEGDPK